MPTHAELLAKRVEYRDRIQRLNADLRAPLNPDSEEQATQLENRDVMAEIRRVTQMELNEVERRIREEDWDDE